MLGLELIFQVMRMSGRHCLSKGPRSQGFLDKSEN